MKTSVSNRTKRQWRREVYDLLTQKSQPLNMILTDLLASAHSFSAQPLPNPVRAYMRDQVANLWSAARLGWYHAATHSTARPSLRNCTRAERLLHETAFDAGRNALAVTMPKHH